MKLSDVMSSMGLAGYAEAGLILFLFAFCLVAFDVVRRGKALESHAWLPLDGGPGPSGVAPNDDTKTRLPSQPAEQRK